MGAALVPRLSSDWKDRLGLSHRRSPELYESPEAVGDAPHAPAIRSALDALGLSAVFCVQGVPTIAILELEHYDRDRVVRLHASLWNQGLASLLLVISGEVLRAFSVARTPVRGPAEEFDRRCLIDTLGLTADALRVRSLVHGAESGRLWREYAGYFKSEERVDQVLLENLRDSYRLLCAEGLSPSEAQALLIQTMFMAYLEDRGIIGPRYLGAALGRSAPSVSELLEAGDLAGFQSVFAALRRDFNGDLVAPCSFESESSAPELRARHLGVLARFRSGREEMARGGQQRFWGYDFRFIPVELVSAVYDQFLGERRAARRERGAFYTPMFLADTAVLQAWELLTNDARSECRVLDPACGSGVFLVRLFQRLCEHRRAQTGKRTVTWGDLLAIVRRVHGCDVDGDAVRVAVFSLYVALLEEVSPRDIERLVQRGRVLPELWGQTLVCRDFFLMPQDEAFDLVVGNPPWASRRGFERPSEVWCRDAGLPMPGREDAWAFAWKAMRHVGPGGLVALLLPAMGFLHNHAAKAVAARGLFLRTCRVRRIVNFADLRFQLFEHAQRPAALVVYSAGGGAEFPYRFGYWVPKADLNLQLRRVITLSSVDKLTLDVAVALENPLAFKRRLWLRQPDAKLFGYLSRLPKMRDFIEEFGKVRRRGGRRNSHWLIGQGYQPHGPTEQDGEELPERDEVADDGAEPRVSELVGRLPDLPISAFRRLAQPVADLHPAVSSLVRRKGFEAGFQGVRVLVPRGVETSEVRLRAAYCDEPVTFRHIIQAVSVPSRDEGRAKLLTALLNSRVAVWFAFHGTASYGSDRPEVQQAELLQLPFPTPADLPDPAQAEDAAQGLIALVERALRGAKAQRVLQSFDAGELLPELDQLAYRYFCLSKDEIAIVEDGVEWIMPAVQPHPGQVPPLWSEPPASQRAAYAESLAASLRGWFRDESAVSARLEARTADLGIMRLRLNGGEAPYSEAQDAPFGEVLEKLREHIHQPLDGNFQLMPDLRVFAGDSLYLVKPMQMRFWLRSAALADADTIAADLEGMLADRRADVH
jgi:hypothetical protein